MSDTIYETYSYGITFDESSLALNPGIRALLSVSSVFAMDAVLEANYRVGYSFFIESLLASVKIQSLASAEIPNILPEASVSEKFLEMERVLSRFPGILLNIWIDYGQGGWELEAQITLQNKKNQWYPVPLLKPYLTLGEVKPLPKNALLGFSLTDLGHGLLQHGDFVRIQCDARKELSLAPKAAERVGQTASSEQMIPTGQPAVLAVTHRETRKAIYLRNSGETRIYFHFGYYNPDLSELGKKLYLEPGDAWSWENSYFSLPWPLWIEAAQTEGQEVGKLTIFEAF